MLRGLFIPNDIEKTVKTLIRMISMDYAAMAAVLARHQH